ncbi:TetR family transcriptional regulator [Actinocatenispora thailandica]|uniref:TetR family transcriptional regulator n=1 Tax=Actinocatenispora thailandica TaxID=227318 RepID=A0A7R7DUA8_9ACTN|nr:helix-turn-helix domain-containing protein [Actinocatenispora thailandica]BCJ37974.1 TetR family transcriptional regulator [Actinocatenispora thailandica]
MADAAQTRQRILDIALELFTERGFAGTSVADLAGRLGTSKAALYHHFRSKNEILAALLEAPTRRFDELVAQASELTDEQLLGRVVDLTAELFAVAGVLDGDPSVQAAQRAQLLDRSRDINQALTAALVAPPGDADARLRAHAAYAAAKHGTLAAVADLGTTELPATSRTALVTAALRALHPAG